MFSKLLTVGALASTTLAHGTVQSFLTDGAFNQGFLLQYFYLKQQGQATPATAGWYAENLDNGFVSPDSYNKPDIICHKNAEPATSVAKVAAGGKVDFQWTVWPESHVGPVITYVAPYTGDEASIDKTALKWVKIDEAGYDASMKSWAAIDMIATNNTWTTTVPSTLKAGKYVFRHEIIALHSAQQENGAQNYPQCMNIEVTGDGTELPEGTLGTELYTPTDPGIMVNVYNGLTSYQIPGPKLMAAGTPTNGGAAQPSTPKPSAAPATTPVAAPKPQPQAGNGGNKGALPETFTLDTFITWLKQNAGGASKKARRHAREF